MSWFKKEPQYDTAQEVVETFRKLIKEEKPRQAAMYLRTANIGAALQAMAEILADLASNEKEKEK